MFRDLWHWWRDGLAAPWPQWLRGGARRCRLKPTGSGYRVSCRRRSTWRTVAETKAGELSWRTRRRLRSSQVVLELTGENALVRTVRIPPGADPSSHTRAILEELSPLPLDQQCVDSVPADDEVTLVIAKRSLIEQLREDLRCMGIRLSGVTVSGLEDTPLNLLPPEQRAPAPVDRIGLGLVGVGVILCASALFQWTQHQADVLADLTAQEASLQQQLQSGQPVRDRIAGLREKTEVISNRKLSAPPALSVLSAVTRAVPDHSWVRQWILNEESLTVFGETTDPADLISRLEASPALSEVRYESAITRDASSGEARIRIAATVVGE